MQVKILATGSKGNCYIVSDGNTKVLVDPGISYTKILKRSKFAVMDAEACLISHEHGDHVKGIEMMSKAVPIVATAKTLETLGKYKLGLTKAVKPMVPEMFGTLRVTAFPVVHNAVDPVGYHIKSILTMESLVYVTDSQYLYYTFEGLKALVIECNYDDETLSYNVENGLINENLARNIRQYHQSADNVISFLKAHPCLEKVWLIHSSENNLNEDKTIERIKQVYNKKLFTKEDT